MGNLWMSVCVGVLIIKNGNSNENQNSFESVDSLFCESCDDYPDDIFVDFIDNEPLATTDLVVPYPSFAPPTADHPFPHPHPYIPTVVTDSSPDPNTPYSTEHSQPFDPITSTSTETAALFTESSATSTETISDPIGPTDITPFPQCEQVIQTTTPNNQTITWPSTRVDEEAVSNPLCLDEFLKIVKRKCYDNWEPEPTCSSIQQPINPCPSDLMPTDEGRYCYSIINATRFPPACPYPGILGWDDQINWHQFLNRTMWMPIKRDDSEIDVFRYIEPTYKYNMPYQICTQSCQNIFYNDTFLDKRCLVYHNATHVEAVSCDAEYPAICIYDSISYQEDSFCTNTYPECKQGGYTAASVCFCETTHPHVGNEVLAEFLEPFQNLLFANKTCGIGLQNTFNETSSLFVWANSQAFLNYTYWSPNATFDFQNGSLTSSGWTMVEESPNCSIYELDIPIQRGSIELSIIGDNSSYKVEIRKYKNFLSRNNKPLIYCFTDADAKSIFSPVVNFTDELSKEDTYIMNFPPITADQSGSGNYWCEAFLYPNLEIITSEKKIISNYKAEYVVILRLADYEETLSAYPLKPENLATLQNLFRNELSCVSFYPRIFKINHIDEGKKTITITFHLTSATASSTQEEFNMLNNISMAQTIFDFVDFRTVHYCPRSITCHEGQTIVWPLTPGNQQVDPENGYCVTANVTFIQRSCIGNFNDGMYWSKITELCQFYPASSITKNIINIVDQTEDNVYSSALVQLQNITSSYYDKFNTLDVVLIAQFMKDVSMKKLNYDVLAGIVSNLMKISRPVLLSAQQNFKSTDTLLQAMDAALENADCGVWKESNYVIASLNISSGVKGFQLQNCSNYRNCDIVNIYNENVLNDRYYIKSEKISAAVILSTNLYNQICEYSITNKSYTPKLIASIYYGSQLFVDIENSKSSDMVFGVLLPGFTNQNFSGPITIYYYNNLKSNSLEYNCSYWKFSDENAGTWAAEDTEEIDDAVACEFYHITNFGIPFSILEHFVDTKQMCYPDDEVNRKCFTRNQEELCSVIKLQGPINEYCLTENLTLVSTSCFHNFTGVAYMSAILDNCTVHQLSQPIKNMFNGVMKIDNDEVTLDQIILITRTYSKLNEVGLLVVASYMGEISNKTMDMAKLSEIVNNLMKVPKPVLYSAQQKYRVLDMLLSTIEEALAFGDCGEWKTDNFAIKCVEIDEVNVGLFLENCSENANDCDLAPMVKNMYANNKNHYAAIALSDILHNQILNYKKNNPTYVPKLMVSIYYGSQLFVDVNARSSKAQLVFGVLIPHFHEDFLGALLIYYLQDMINIQYNCSYWKFNETSYGSWVVEASLFSNQTVVCGFFHLTNFVIPVNRLLNESLNDAHSITIHHDYMPQPNTSKYHGYITDNNSKKYIIIESVCSILDTIEPPLELLANTINALMEINEDTIFEAQSSFQIADKILFNIDRILHKVVYTSQVKARDILFITVSQEDVKYFKGFFITQDKDALCIFQEAENIEDTYVDVRVTLSPQLRDQVKDAKSAIIFTVFFSKILFPAADQTKVRLPIIEVLIPNLHEDLKGSISIKYKDTYKGECSYWDHEIVGNKISKSGTWKRESQAEINGNAVTCHFQHVTHFALVSSSQNITTDLEEILASNLTGLEKLKRVETITTSNPNYLVAVDIYLISQILTNSLPEGAISTVVTSIISSLFMVPREVLRESQRINSATDIILYAVDEMAQMVTDLDLHYQNFSLVVKNLYKTNLTGLMLHSCENYKCTVDQLTEFINISDYSGNDSVSAMVIFSEELINQIRNQTKVPKVAISIYYSDILFNEIGFSRNTTIIFGVVFPGLTDTLDGPVSVIYNLGTKSTNDDNQCAYWFYKADPNGNLNNATLGEWMNDTNKQRENKLAICNYTHVTHFGMLLANNDDYDDDPIIDLITEIGCVLSLFGIFVILVTAMLFKKWRQNTGNIILINFSVAISVKIITLYVSAYVKSTSSGISCTFTGIILHYATLSECAWMLTVAILQFKRFVEVLGGPPKYVLIKALICGWVFPLFPVACVISIDPHNYEKGVANLCYPSNLGLYLSVWLPVLLILTINCVIFTFIIYNVFHKKTECIDSSNHEILFQWRLALLLFFMLGLNWVFGFLGQVKGDKLFTYLYSITASLQGFVLFLFFIVFNKSTTFLYSHSIKQWFYARGIFKVRQSKSKSHRKH